MHLVKLLFQMKKKGKCKMTEAEKREKIASALLRKRECEKKALSIVTRQGYLGFN